MTIALADVVSVGRPGKCGPVSAFPLFVGGSGSLPNLVVGDESAVAQGLLRIGELQRAQVKYADVENTGDSYIVFFVGQRLLKGGQNRIVTCTVVVKPRTKARIPVACEQKRRWNPSPGKAFEPSTSIAPPSVRSTVHESVTRSTFNEGTREADQNGTWQSVDESLAGVHVNSGSSALDDAFTSQSRSIKGYQDELPYVPRACGIALGIGDRIVSLDVFGDPATCKKFWSGIIEGAALDAMRDETVVAAVDQHSVETVLGAAQAARWSKVDLSEEGLAGDESRANFDGGTGSCLDLEGRIVHATLSTG